MILTYVPRELFKTSLHPRTVWASLLRFKVVLIPVVYRKSQLQLAKHSAKCFETVEEHLVGHGEGCEGFVSRAVAAQPNTKPQQ
jgi:hypothetical protein